MRPKNRKCILAFEDGTYCVGTSFGAIGTRVGEVVFNTAMTGYQEVLTDPSYRGQIVIMTYPHIGNYGINPEDMESSGPHVAGFVVKESARTHSNFRAEKSLREFLSEKGVAGIEGVDTRALTRRIRESGAMRGVITTEIADPVECVRMANQAPSMIGANLVNEVAPADPFWYGNDSKKFSLHDHLVVAIDCGMKRNILRHLSGRGCKIRVVPPTFAAQQILEINPDGVFVSNGPGDPAAVHSTIETLRGLVGKVPIFGICLGHQLLALALGGKTFKLKFGHRGANHPVKNLITGKVEITSQNHGFTVDPKSIESAGCTITHMNLNDHTLEGFAHKDLRILAVQYHPEAAPGPHDATYLFDEFVEVMHEQGASTEIPTQALLA